MSDSEKLDFPESRTLLEHSRVHPRERLPEAGTSAADLPRSRTSVLRRSLPSDPLKDLRMLMLG
eukprot:CAMPEP_0181216962 /NCGR_PEP_ID=MMETSP1096-20121128/26881_1 /TAXON_ID=156174 ORGANISM="Chrysochromulina ericina, Strain CCMP281" /NCGR_SAMPLE_ID=MMETSP1096 /ASSEMBLY_ACC=CAM_ASM_000453 /LENGTH=63 /DNA_ID=CAMNT_0023309029 /DNA_START=577 /DNA_END=764 /DNA_ORIENTATION=+